MVLLSSTTLPQIRVFCFFLFTLTEPYLGEGLKKNMTDLTTLNSWVFPTAFTLEVTLRGTNLWLALLMREAGAI